MLHICIQQVISLSINTTMHHIPVFQSFSYSIANAMMWISFAPIQSRASELRILYILLTLHIHSLYISRYFNVSQSQIDFFSLSFMIAYVPGSIICGLMFKKWYLRKSFIFSSGFQFIGSILRYIATLHFISTNSYWSHLPFIIAMIGQSMAALAQPFYTNSPARIPAEWFSKEGRDVATALLSIINPLGIGLGSFIPTMFVTDEGDHWYGFTGIMMLEVICCGVGFILTLLFFYDRPPTSPSMSQRLKKSNLSMKRSLRYDIGQILKNTEFLKLLFGFGIGLGLFNALTTLINQYTAAFGYTTDDAGNFGGILIGAGTE